MALCNAFTGIEFSSTVNDIKVDTISYMGTEFHSIIVEGFSLPPALDNEPGFPLIPRKVSTFLLPAATQIDSIIILESKWDTLPGRYYLYPSQIELLSDTSFTPPELNLYSSIKPFPSEPVVVTRQGSAMGYSVVSISEYPIRYIPADSTVLVLTSISLNVQTGPSVFEQIAPNRETEWSANLRNRAIASLVTNHEDISFYNFPIPVSYNNRTLALNITQSPSLQGDCVDMVILTNAELAPFFQQVADYRTQQGIITVVRTIQWIDQFYNGCDTQERMRNFIIDAHQNWGIQAVLLGGDDGVVPIRECNGWNYIPGPFPSYLLPSDDYYADIDGNWSYDGSNWRSESSQSYLDLCVGRWPVNSAEDVNLMFTKLKVYEQPEMFPEDFARKILLIGSNNPAGSGANDMIELEIQLKTSSAIPIHLDLPTTLYFPHYLQGGDLSRITALEEFNQGYNLIIHADHSEIHKLATAGNGTLGQYLWDSDFSTITNENKPSILWTLGCDTGHFDGAYCYSEAGLLTSENSALIAVMSNSRGGLHSQKVTAYAFIDALYNTNWITNQNTSAPLHWPLSFLGEAYRCSKNVTNLSFIHLNLLGSPLMYVWRNDPVQLSISVPPLLLQEGVSEDITLTVHENENPIENVSVCLWKKDELFSILETDSQGMVTFSDVCAIQGDDDIVITAVKRRVHTNMVETTTIDYLPAQVFLDVLPADIPIVSLQDFTVDPNGDGSANPGEIVEINLLALNSGGVAASDISVEMTIVSGHEHINSVLVDQTNFPFINPGETDYSLNPLVVEINKNTPNYSTIEFNICFSFKSEDVSFSWNSPLFLTVFSENYQVTVVNSSADNSTGQYAEVILSDIVLNNCGLGEGENLLVTVDNFIPPVYFQSNILSVPSIQSNHAVNLDGELVITVLPDKLDSSWLKPGFPGCSFDVTVLSNGGNFFARNVNVELIAEMSGTTILPPTELAVYEAGENFLSLTWQHFTQPESVGYYIYCDDGVVNRRVFSDLVPVKQITIEDLPAGREYEIQVTAIDAIGRESEAVSITTGTICPVVDGWPVFLEGSPGGGAVIADIDNDGNDEIITITSFGIVNIIQRDGSIQKLYPPAGFDFDRFLGCAVGDIDDDNLLEIVVSCQRKIEVVNQEQISVLVFDKFGGFWSSTEIAVTNVNEEAASPNIAGTPVLFQADTGNSLEIALRTRGSNGGIPHLYVWKQDSVNGTWSDYSSDFPISLPGWFYNSPSAVDFDADGFEELIVSVYGSSGTGTALKIIDFDADGSIETVTCNLSKLDTEGKIARAFGTLALAEEHGIFYIAGIAKPEELCSELKKIFVYTIESGSTIDLSLAWQSEWLTGFDSFSNIPGPAIGNIDGNDDLEVVYTLNGGFYDSEAFVFAWDLSSGEIEFQSDTIPFNPILGGGGATIKSQPVIGLTADAGSGEMTIFSGFSSLLTGFAPSENSGMIDGFPSSSRDGAWAAPALCDLDRDGVPEILYIDYSGFASLFNWQEGVYTTDGWHMYQDNPHRTGFYNMNDRNELIDISILGKPYMNISNSSVNNDMSLWAEILITGAEETSNNSIILSDDFDRINEQNARQTLNSLVGNFTIPINSINDSFVSTPLINSGVVDVVVFSHDLPVGKVTIPLEQGAHSVQIPLRFGTAAGNNLTVVVDPFNLLMEADETNNEARIFEIPFYGNDSSVSVTTPTQSVVLEFYLASSLPVGLDIKLYSIDGRVVIDQNTGQLQTGFTRLQLSEEAELPSGMYTIRINGLDFDEVIQKIIILDI